MAPEPRWLHERSGEDLIVKVGPFYAPAQFRLPAALEPELRSWFRRRRLQGWAVAAVLISAILIAATQSWIESDVPLFVALVALASLWPWLSGNTPRQFTRRFSDATLVGSTGQPVSIVENGVAFENAPDGTVELRQLYGTGAGYRIPAAQAGRAQIWFKRARVISWAAVLPTLAALAAILVSDLTPGQTLVATLVVIAALAVLYPMLSRFLFLRAFPDAAPLAGKKSFLAAQAAHPLNRRVAIRVVLVLLLNALLIWGFVAKGEVTMSDLPFAALVLALTGYTVAIAVVQFRSRAPKRTGAPD